MKSKLAQWFADVFELDVRSLAVFRVGLALILLVDLAVRFPWIEAHYTDVGAVPRYLMKILMRPGQWSLHAQTGDPAVVMALFAIAAVVAGALLVGFKTRVATVVSWVLLVSLHNRCGPVLNSGDDLLRALLFWSMFLPLGSVWSVDAHSREPSPRAVGGLPGVALIVQIVLVYWTVMVARIGVPAWSTGNAVWLALHMDGYTTDAGRWVRDTLTPLLRPMTYAAMAVETLGPLLAFSPWKTPQIRTLAVLVFWGLHLSFAILMEVGLFWAVSCTSWAVLLPSWFWERAQERVSALRVALTPERSDQRSVIWGPVGVALAAVLVINVQILANRNQAGFSLPGPVQLTINALRLDQNWTVYSPPTKNDGWFVADATLTDGTTVDLWTGARPSTLDRPDSVNRHYLNQRWRHTLYTLHLPKRAQLRAPVANWLVHRHEQEHPDEQVESVKLRFVKVMTGLRKEKAPEVVELGVYRMAVQTKAPAK